MPNFITEAFGGSDKNPNPDTGSLTWGGNDPNWDPWQTNTVTGQQYSTGDQAAHYQQSLDAMGDKERGVGANTADYTGANDLSAQGAGALGQGMGVLGQEASTAQYLQGIANGKGQTAADIQAQQNLNQSVAQQMGVAASAKGGAMQRAEAMRNGAATGASMQQRAISDNAARSFQERMGAAQGYGQMAGQMAGQYGQMASGYGALGAQQAQQNQFNAQAQDRARAMGIQAQQGWYQLGQQPTNEQLQAQSGRYASDTQAGVADNHESNSMGGAMMSMMGGMLSDERAKTAIKYVGEDEHQSSPGESTPAEDFYRMSPEQKQQWLAAKEGEMSDDPYVRALGFSPRAKYPIFEDSHNFQSYDPKGWDQYESDQKHIDELLARYNEDKVLNDRGGSPVRMGRIASDTNLKFDFGDSGGGGGLGAMAGGDIDSSSAGASAAGAAVGGDSGGGMSDLLGKGLKAGGDYIQKNSKDGGSSGGGGGGKISWEKPISTTIDPNRMYSDIRGKAEIEGEGARSAGNMAAHMALQAAAMKGQQDAKAAALAATPRPAPAPVTPASRAVAAQYPRSIDPNKRVVTPYIPPPAPAAMAEVPSAIARPDVPQASQDEVPPMLARPEEQSVTSDKDTKKDVKPASSVATMFPESWDEDARKWAMTPPVGASKAGPNGEAPVHGEMVFVKPGEGFNESILRNYAERDEAQEAARQAERMRSAPTPWDSMVAPAPVTPALPMRSPKGQLPRVTSDERTKTGGAGGMKGNNSVASFLDSLEPFEYRYKNPSDAPSGRPDAKGDKYIGVMAQNVEHSKTGHSIVGQDERGKKYLEFGPMLSAMAAGLGQVHERLGKLESKGG